MAYEVVAACSTWNADSRPCNRTLVARVGLGTGSSFRQIALLIKHETRQAIHDAFLFSRSYVTTETTKSQVFHVKQITGKAHSRLL